jgi:hypothetical protein
MGIGEGMLLLTVGGAAGAPVRITLHGLGPPPEGGTLHLAGVSGIGALALETTEGAIQFRLDATGHEAVALIGLESGGLPIDAIHARRADRVP